MVRVRNLLYSVAMHHHIAIYNFLLDKPMIILWRNINLNIHEHRYCICRCTDDFPYFNFIRLIVQLVLFCIREKKNSELRMNIQSYEFVYFLYLKKIKKSDIPLNNTKRCLLCCVNSATIMWHMKY